MLLGTAEGRHRQGGVRLRSGSYSPGRIGRSGTPEAPRNAARGHQASRGEVTQDTRHGGVPDIPQETCEMIINLVREEEAREIAAYYDWHLTNLMTAAVKFFRASRHRFPEGLGNPMGPNGGVKWSTIDNVGDRMQYYYRLTRDNYRDMMKQYGRKRGCVELEYLMVVFGRLVGYYGMARAIRMLSMILRSLEEGIESAERPASNFIPRPEDSEDEDDLTDPPDPGLRPPKPTHTVLRRV